MLHSSPDRRLSSITNNQRGSSGNAADIVQSFIGLAGITDITQITAINTLYNDLVSAGLWNKIQLLYPFIGGNQTAHSINLKDPSQYPLGFVGSVIHNANGVTGTASQNASFSTAYSMTLLGNVNDFSFGLYGRTPSGGGTGAVGNYGFATDLNFTSPLTHLFFRADGQTTGTIRLASGVISGSGFLNSANARFMAVTSDSATTGFTFSNQFTVLTNLSKGSNLGTSQIAAQLSNTSVANAMSYSIWYVGLAMTEAELVTLNAIFQKFNDTLDTAFGSTRGTDYYINPSYDRNVNRFVSNVQVPGVSTFTTTELNALQYLVTALQNSSTNLWGNLTQIYPFIGSNISGRVRELKGLGSTFGTSSGTFNFSTTIGLDATSAASYVTPAAPLATTVWTTAILYGVYVSEDFTSTGYEIGYGASVAAASRYSLNVRNASNNAVVAIGNLTAVTVSNTNAIGHYTLVSGGTGAAVTLYKNGSSVGSGTAGTTNASGALNMFGGQSGSSASQRIQGISYFFLGNWTVAQVTEMNSIIQTYILMLGR